MSTAEGATPTLVKRSLTRRDLHFYVNTLIIELTKPEFQDKLKDEARKEPVPRTSEELLDRFDEVQASFFNTVPLKVPADEDPQNNAKPEVEKGDASSPPAAEVVTATPTATPTKIIFCDGDDIVAQVKLAAKTFPDKETERLLMRMCTALEALVYSVSTAVPELRGVTQQMERETAMMGHGHSHGGQPCNHNHGHDHGHSHGAGRGGNVVPAPTPEMERMVGMAMGTLSQEQKDTLDRVQKTMNSGSPPTPEDMQKMFVIQQHIMAFMSTMEKFMSGGGGQVKK